MRTLNKYIAGISTAVVLLTAMSCSKEFYTDKNKNPNAPNSALPNVLLTPVEVSLAYAQGGDMSRFASMFVQQTTGVSRQSAAYNEYVFTNQDPESLWDNLYTAAMYNDYNLMQICNNGQYNAYKGITEVLMAYSLQITVDCWGPIPYSQAFQGANNLKPAYDNDRKLYATIDALCYQAINDLNNTANDALSPGSDDVVYFGQTGEWIEFAHAILARIFIHQSQTGNGNAAMADSALAHVALSFASNADNAQVSFGLAANNNAPNYQFYTQRGDISYVNGFFGVLSTTNDPRKFALIDSANQSQGNYLDAYYQLANSPVEFICYDEMNFIAAEATIRTNGSASAAQNDYTNGIQADIAKVSSNPTIYGAGNPNPGMMGAPTTAQINAYLAEPGIGTLSANTDSALAQVANQEYIALYMNPEAWALWRRSTKIPGFANGSPALLPVSGPFQSDGIPRRFLYPQSELNLNGSNVPSATEWSPRVFWDN
ncbi:MAG TPA: SusD/RagB family nutrient-binding outer membrane lipoprotein [Bacteroidia bacterium]|nr:SusD/RagB family nutrient-binding outer membrane lipoprotein [Bacteroidia bacterium]